ncbi:hypothetical protein RFI_30509 [Reticulomyxa filosa]|uniref:Uncharacterized protein n=1 Tax=Reticulomyxa filosa TaxID=46433 RepID=X6LYB7_RETFI|nr:hypothetical protein RFI_30509 [Reticulomyxa filosa]|eukprot:ETO06883.1 hypothetical protein RFI_30509 [Reticulomyxa filosa]
MAILLTCIGPGASGKDLALFERMQSGGFSFTATTGAKTKQDKDICLRESDSNDNAQMTEQVEIIYNRLNEVEKKKLKDYHCTIFEYFPKDIMEKYRHQTTTDSFRSLHCNAQLREADELPWPEPYAHWTALSHRGCQFYTLFLEFQRKVDDDIDTRPVLEAIDINLKEIEMVERQLQQIKEAKQYVIEFVDEMAQKDIGKKRRRIRKFAFQQWMEVVLGTVDALVNASNFFGGRK